MATSAVRKPPRVPASPHLHIASNNDRRPIVELKSADFESMDEPTPKSSIHPLKPPPLPQRQASVSVVPPNSPRNSGDASETLVDATSPEIWIDVEEVPTEPMGRASSLLPNPPSTRADFLPKAVSVQPKRSIGLGSLVVLTLLLNAVVSVAISTTTVKWIMSADRTTTTKPLSESTGTTSTTTLPKSTEMSPAAATEPNVTPKTANAHPSTSQGKLAAKSKPLTSAVKTPTTKQARSARQ